MLSLIRPVSVVLITTLFSLQSVNPSLGKSVQKEQLVAQETEVVEVTELTINPPLSQEQERKLSQINQEYQPKLEQALRNYSESLKAFEDLLGTNPTSSTLRTRHEKMLEDRMNLLNLAFSRLMDFRDVLTPEQQKSLSDDIRQLLEK